MHDPALQYFISAIDDPMHSFQSYTHGHVWLSLFGVNN